MLLRLFLFCLFFWIFDPQNGFTDVKKQTESENNKKDYFTGEKNKLLIQPMFGFYLNNRLTSVNEDLDLWVFDKKPHSFIYGFGFGFIQQFEREHVKKIEDNETQEYIDYYLLNHYVRTMVRFGYLRTWNNAFPFAIKTFAGVGYFWSLNTTLQHSSRSRKGVQPAHSFVGEIGISFMFADCFDITMRYLYLNKVEMLESQRHGVGVFSLSIGMIFDI